MVASIINIGDELLIGQVINTNASWMAERLNDVNVQVKEIVVVSDDEASITESILRCSKGSDMVILSGGLGPTKDDITKNTLCRMFEDSLVVDERTREHVEGYFIKRGLPMLEVNNMQSMVPSRCKVLFNLTGTAPGMWFEEEGKIVVSLPGVPHEMKYLMDNEVLPRIEEMNEGSAVIHKTVLTYGIGESYLAEMISEWEEGLPDHIKLAYLPKRGQVRLRLSAYGIDKTVLEKEVAERLSALELLIDKYIYGYDKDSLLNVVGRALIAQGETVSCAESCTGGNLASMLTSISGASSYYKGGVVSYDNTIKMGVLGVDEGIIKNEGAVSEACAIAMAEGCRKLMGTSYSIATTGISGPTGGSEDKPVGTVYIAISTEKGSYCNLYNFKNIRTEHQLRTSNQAIFDLWEILKANK